MQNKGPQKLNSMPLLGLEWPGDWHGFSNHGALVETYVNKCNLIATPQNSMNSLEGTFQH